MFFHQLCKVRWLDLKIMLINLQLILTFMEKMINFKTTCSYRFYNWLNSTLLEQIFQWSNKHKVERERSIKNRHKTTSKDEVTSTEYFWILSKVEKFHPWRAGWRDSTDNNQNHCWFLIEVGAHRLSRSHPRPSVTARSCHRQFLL